jgi:hypothetical protein
MVHCGYQDMISFDSPDVIRERHKQICEFRECTEQDIILFNVEDARGLEKKQGFKTLYNLKWFTAKGWQAYMQHTGIYAIAPQN